jgi:hypothetical protein
LFGLEKKLFLKLTFNTSSNKPKRLFVKWWVEDIDAPAKERAFKKKKSVYEIFFTKKYESRVFYVWRFHF